LISRRPTLGFSATTLVRELANEGEAEAITKTTLDDLLQMTNSHILKEETVMSCNLSPNGKLLTTLRHLSPCHDRRGFHAQCVRDGIILSDSVVCAV